jgi:hypothetical protein
MRQKWMEFKAEHLTYFDPQTLQTALFKSNFREVIVEPGWKMLSFDYVKMHFERFPVPVVTPVLNFMARLLPKNATTASSDRCQRHDGFLAQSGGAAATGAFRDCSGL